MSESKKYWGDKLKIFLHDPIDKCFDIRNHVQRAKHYADIIGVSDVDKVEGPDWIASCMERGLLPKGIFQDFTEIRHPFSDGKIDVNVKMFSKEFIFPDVESAYRGIEGKNDFDDKRKFFYIWRNLQDLIFEKAKGKSWVEYLPILPADTRVPDHSIWEHLKIASAINAYLDSGSGRLIQNNSLFLFSIGPVQSFIAQARKTQDFYMGSFILSFLTFKVIEVIIDMYGPTNIIYPDLYKQPFVDFWMKHKLGIEPIGFDEASILIPTIPNRFVAILPLSNESEINDIVVRMREKITKDSIQEAKETIFSEFKLESHISDKIRNKIDSQLSEFPEIYWVALPWRINDK
ncbi:MAG: type III-B CRISPR-associated protein Cas10/Cmr2, partial [Candidatus Kryptonium sp.]